MEFIYAILIIFGILLFILFLSSRQGKYEYDVEKQKELVGKKAEQDVSSLLKELVKKYGGYSYDNIALSPNPKYPSFEIDHILINKAGIFIIETKGKSAGLINGDLNDDKFIVYDHYGNEVGKIDNPFIQNKKHIERLARLFTNNKPILNNIIIFTNSDELNIKNNKNIYFSLNEFKNYIDKLMINPKYSNEFVSKYNKIILEIFSIYKISHEQHINNIKDLYL